VCKLTDVEWDDAKGGRVLKDGCLGILYWADRAEHTFEIVDQPWLREYTAYSWRFL